MKIKVRQRYLTDRAIGYEIYNPITGYWNTFYPDLMNQSTFDLMISTARKLTQGQQAI